MIFYLSGNCATFEPERWFDEKECINIMPTFWMTVEANKKRLKEKKVLEPESRIKLIHDARVAEAEGMPVPDTRRIVTSRGKPE